MAKHEIARSSFNGAQCTCGHYELAETRLAALVALEDHFDETAREPQP